MKQRPKGAPRMGPGLLVVAGVAILPAALAGGVFEPSRIAGRPIDAVAHIVMAPGPGYPKPPVPRPRSGGSSSSRSSGGFVFGYSEEAPEQTPEQQRAYDADQKAWIEEHNRRVIKDQAAEEEAKRSPEERKRRAEEQERLNPPEEPAMTKEESDAYDRKLEADRRKRLGDAAEWKQGH